MGAWRIEVAPASAAQDDVFLHIIEVGDRGETNRLPARLERETGWAGVAFARKGIAWKIRFRTQGDMGADVKIIRGDRTLSALLDNTVQPQSGFATVGAAPGGADSP
jgi:hypothetical protein